MSTLTALLKLESVLLVLLLFPCQHSACSERAALPPLGSLEKPGRVGRMQEFLFILSPTVSEDAAGCLCHSADNDIQERSWAGLCKVECIACE